MKNIVKITLSVFILSIGIWILYQHSNYEITISFLENFVCGGLTVLSVDVLLILALIQNIKRENNSKLENPKYGLSSLILLLVCIYFVIPSLITFFLPSGKTDKYIYENIENKDEFIICQEIIDWEYLDHRIIRTHSKNSIIRKIELLEKGEIRKAFIFHIDSKYDEIRKTLVYENKTYRLLDNDRPIH